MADPLIASMSIASSGLEAQSMRLRVVSENLANSESAGRTPGSDPYRRKTLAFTTELDRVSGAPLVKADRLVPDPSPFRREYQPGHPAADPAGYVKLPNVNMLTEMADMREAGRSYEANLQIIRQSRDMMTMTIDLLRGS